MNIHISPSKANGTVAAPPSKSMAHRLLICAGLSSGHCIVHGIAPSQDVLATLDCLSALGVSYTYDGSNVEVHGSDINKQSDQLVLPCRECGSTLRFFIPIALLTGKNTLLTGSEKLLSRPLTVYEDICSSQNIAYQTSSDGVHVCGRLQATTYTVAGNISSQFISGLLFALPLLDGHSTIKILPPVESRSYINMTIQALSTFGVRITWLDDTTLLVPGNQSYHADEVTVEGDYSNAAFLDAFNLLGGHVHVTGLNNSSLQGDQIYRSYYELLKHPNAVIDLSDCPDLGPILFTVAAYLNGAHFTGTKRLKIKESDRGVVMQEELSKFGVKMDVQENDIYVEASTLKHPEQLLNGHNDHRIVMSLSVLSSITGGIITGIEAVNKSFPDFFDKIQSLGINTKNEFGGNSL